MAGWLVGWLVAGRRVPRVSPGGGSDNERTARGEKRQSWKAALSRRDEGGTRERDRGVWGKVEGNRHPFAKSNWLMPRK